MIEITRSTPHPQEKNQGDKGTNYLLMQYTVWIHGG